MSQRFLIALALLTLLGGCGSSGNDDLKDWMATERAQTKPRVTPLTEPKQFQPVGYDVKSEIDPFDPMKLTQALRRETAQLASNAALIAPELARRKEPLEAFPLDAVSMVGSLNKEGRPTALVKVDKLLYQVQAGNYLGQNYGRIVAINETSIQLREIVQDPAGDWIERTTSLELQEEAKK
jgi:type IV pilus assembly protein PilP